MTDYNPDYLCNEPNCPGRETYEAVLEEYRAEIERLRAAVVEAERMFNWYGDLHAIKPDPDNAARNYDMAKKMAAALGSDSCQPDNGKDRGYGKE